ncbi:MAG: helix-turn-helix transcriptional regulator [Jiangellaceae bacterium]
MARADFDTPLVGRAREVQVLTEALERAGRGEPGAVLVSGDAGVGKTRLLAEVTDRAARTGATVLVGHCIDVGGVGLPYLPFTEALRPLTVAGGGETPGGWQGVELDAGPAPGGDVSQLQLFDAVAGMLARAGTDSAEPVLLVLEDLHWADQSTRDLLAFLLGRMRAERLLIVGSYRSDDLHRRHPLRPLVAQLVRLPVVERLELRPFDVDEMGHYLAALRGAPVDEVTVRRILDRSEGNAYYAQELLHASGSHDTHLLPAPLADVLLTRLEQLSSTAQLVVRVASVAGRRVSHELLAGATDLAPPDLESTLREAAAHYVLVAENGERYAFRHALLGEAVYGDLLPGERVRLHATYARLIDGSADDRVPLGSAAELAHHRMESHDMPGALTASVRAADEAEKLHAPAEAWRHLELVLQLWDAVDDAEERAGADTVRVGLRAAAMASRAGENSRAAALADAAAARLPPDAEPLRAAAVHHKRALHLLSNDHPEHALAAAEESLHFAARASDKPTAPSAWSAATAARALSALDRQDEARKYAERARAEAIEIGSAGAEADALVSLAFLENREGMTSTGAEMLARARELAQESGDLPTEMRVSYNLAAERYDAGDVDHALRLLDAAVERCLATGLAWSPYGLELQVLQVVARYVAGDWGGSVSAARRAGATGTHRPPDVMAARLTASSLYVAAARGQRAGQATVTQLEKAWHYDPLIAMVAGGCGSELLRWRGDLPAALDLGERALRYVEDAWPHFLGGVWMSAVGLAAAGDLAEHARLIHDDAALEAATEAGARLLAHARTTAKEGSPRGGTLGPEGRAWLLRAEAEHSRVAGAFDVELWRRCVEEFGYGHSYEVARSRWRLAEALLGTDRRDEAAAAAAAAHETAVTLGADPLREAVEALVRRGRLDAGIAGAKPADGAALLTAREREVLALLAEGRTNRQIGQQLYIAEKTASVHVSNILAKLGASGRTEAVTIAHRRGMLDAPVR